MRRVAGLRLGALKHNIEGGTGVSRWLVRGSRVGPRKTSVHVPPPHYKTESAPQGQTSTIIEMGLCQPRTAQPPAATLALRIRFTQAQSGHPPLNIMTLFEPDLVDLNKLGPLGHDEPIFRYVQSSARPEFAQIRELLERWFADYPEEHKHELKQRFVTSRSDIASPTFELALHALFKRLGATVEIHPKASDTSDHRPDFLVQMPCGFEFYVEAVISSGQSDKELNQERVVNRLYEFIDRRLQSPEFFWSATVRKKGTASPSGAKAVHELRRYMQGLNRDDVLSRLISNGFRTVDCLRFEDAGWLIEFEPIPVKPEAIGKPGHRPLGAFPGATVWCSNDSDIRRSIKSKAKHHDTVTKPLMIAVNATHWSVSPKDIVNAIYGSNRLTVTHTSDGKLLPVDTRGDGVWIKSGRAKYEHLIGIFGVVGLHPSSIAGCSLTLYENPYVEMPASARIAGLPRYENRDGILLPIAGKTLGELFGLPEGFPSDNTTWP